MTDDDSGLSQSEADRWDAIVSSEWPIEAAILTAQLSSASTPSGATAGQRFVTVYQPRRPRLTPIAVGVVAFAASVWLTIQILIPMYQGAVLASISRSERAIEVHDLTVSAALTALTVLVAEGCFAVWVVATARYRLRRSSCRFVASHSTPVTVYVRPPNPATAATWILLLLAASTAAGWWIPLQLDRTRGGIVDASEALHLAATGGLAWLAMFVLSTIGLTVWVARESRHQLRCSASHGASLSDGGVVRRVED